jgi:hypothetical protein
MLVAQRVANALDNDDEHHEWYQKDNCSFKGMLRKIVIVFNVSMQYPYY